MKELICKNCGHSETLEKINGSNVTKILIAPYPRERKKDGLHIYPLYCLKCNYITEWSADSQNISNKAIDGIEYFTNDMESGNIYELGDDGDPGDKVGWFENSIAFFS